VPGFNDCQRLIKDEIAALLSPAAGKQTVSKGETQKENLQALYDYITLCKIWTTIERNYLMLDSYQLKLKSNQDHPHIFISFQNDIHLQPTDALAGGKQASKSTKPDDLVRLLEIVILSLMELDEMRDKAHIEEGKQIAAKILSLKGFRAYFMAVSSLWNLKWADSVALFEVATKLALSAIDHHNSCGSPSRDELSRLQKLRENITANRCFALAKSFLETLQAPSPTASEVNGDILENVNRYDSSFLSRRHLIDFPPDYHAIHCRPLLFDLALLSCELPPIDTRKAAKRRLFGFW